MRPRWLRLLGKVRIHGLGNPPTSRSNLTELEAKYDVVASIPGRNPTTLLKIVKAIPKDGSAPEDIVENQDYKLFLEPLPTVTTLLCPMHHALD